MQTNKGASVHNWRLEKYFGKEEKKIEIKEIKCVKESSAVVLRGSSSTKNEFLAVLYLNQQANASKNVFQIFEIEKIAPNFTNDKAIISAYSDLNDRETIIITITDHTTGKFVVQEIKIGGIEARILPSQNFPKMNTLTTEAKNSKITIQTTDVTL